MLLKLRKLLKIGIIFIGDKHKNLNIVDNDILVEFLKAEQKQLSNQITDKLIIKPHSQAYHTSHLLDFTIKLNEVLESENSECIDCSI